MSDLWIAAVWCVLQVTLLALIGIAATQRLGSGNAGLGVRFISVVLCLIFVATCFVSFPLAAPTQEETGTAALDSAAIGAPARGDAEDQSHGVAFNLVALRAVIARAQQAVPVSRDVSVSSWWIAGVIVIQPR